MPLIGLVVKTVCSNLLFLILTSGFFFSSVLELDICKYIYDDMLLLLLLLVYSYSFSRGHTKTCATVDGCERTHHFTCQEPSPGKLIVSPPLSTDFCFLKSWVQLFFFSDVFFCWVLFVSTQMYRSMKSDLGRQGMHAILSTLHIFMCGILMH